MRAVGAAKHFWWNDPPPIEPLRFRQAPVLLAAGAFATGILLARHYQPPALICAATLVLLALAAFTLKQRTATLAVAAFLLAAGCWCAQLEAPLPHHRELTPYADGLLRTVHARVTRVRPLKPAAPSDDPATGVQPWEAEPGAWEADRATPSQSLDLALDELETVTAESSSMTAASGGLRVTVLGPALPLRCGDVLTGELRLRRPEVYRDPGAFSGADALAQQGIALLATAKPGALSVTGHAKPSIPCRLHAAQNWAASRLDGYLASRANRFSKLTAEDGAMLSAMLFGDRSGLTTSLRAGFERTGTFHLFVVSGLHVSILAGGLLWLFRRMRLRDSLVLLLTLGLTTGYALLTGFGVPVQRALLMTAAYLLARFLARQSSALNALGTAAMFVLVLSPRALYEASFQMTFLVILAVAGLAVPLKARSYGPFERSLTELDDRNRDITMEPRVAAFRVRIRMAEELLVDLATPLTRWLPRAMLWLFFRTLDALLYGLAIELCMMLPMALYFHRATWTALPTNLLCIPLITALLPLSLLFFLAALLSAWLALPFAALTSWLLHLTRWVVSHASHAHLADLRLPAPAPAALAVACVAIALSVFALRERGRLWLALGLAAAALAPVCTLYPARPLLRAGMLEVTAIDVGQGDSVFVATPTGKTLLIDAGGPVGFLHPGFDVGDEVVAPYLWSRRVRRLDALALTHAHSDHMGGMPALLRDLRPRELWLSIDPGRSAAFAQLLRTAQEMDIPVRRFHAGDSFSFGGVQTDVLAPEATYANASSPRNNDSLVLQLHYGKSTALLEGDAEAPSEAAMLANNRIAPVTLLKVAHHGSRTSTTPAFLAAARPQAAVISVGRANTFGHPRFEVLSRLEAAGAKTYRTDQGGAETFLLDAEGRVEKQ